MTLNINIDWRGFLTYRVTLPDPMLAFTPREAIETAKHFLAVIAEAELRQAEITAGITREPSAAAEAVIATPTVETHHEADETAISGCDCRICECTESADADDRLCSRCRVDPNCEGVAPVVPAEAVPGVRRQRRAEDRMTGRMLRYEIHVPKGSLKRPTDVHPSRP